MTLREYIFLVGWLLGCLVCLLVYLMGCLVF